MPGVQESLVKILIDISPVLFRLLFPVLPDGVILHIDTLPLLCLLPCPHPCLSVLQPGASSPAPATTVEEVLFLPTQASAPALCPDSELPQQEEAGSEPWAAAVPPVSALCLSPVITLLSLFIYYPVPLSLFCFCPLFWNTTILFLYM